MKELKINIPKGYEIDKTNSTFECIKFKKRPETIIKWDILNSKVKVQDEGECFLINDRPSTVMSWHDAKRYVNSIWKLPTRKQLQIISKHLEIINNLMKENEGYKITGCFWTCEEKDKSYAWTVNMYRGYTSEDHKCDTVYYVRTIRNLNI